MTNTADNNAGVILMGAFGADRVADRPDMRPEVDDGTGTKTTVTGAMTVLEDGMLKMTTARYGWVLSDNDMLSDIQTKDYTAITDDIDTDEDESMRTYEEALATLFNNQNSERNVNGPKWVDMAREEIETIRTKLAALLETEQDPGGAQADLWRQFQLAVATNLFGKAEAIDNMAASDLGGAYDKDEALDLIDDTLQALSSSGALDDALDEDGGGVFTDDDGDPFDPNHANRTPTEMWAERDSQVKMYLGATDYTRFGIWRVRRSASALRTNPDTGANEQWQVGEDGEFAYSPLPATTYSAGDPTFPVGGTATYLGSTVAWAKRTDIDTAQQVYLEGSIELTVMWTADRAGGLTAVISDLQDTDGDLLSVVGTGDIAQLVFTGTTVTFNDDNQLVFNGDTPVDVRAEFLNRSINSQNFNGAGTLEGMFVGRTQDGPLGVIGRWTLDDGGINHQGAAAEQAWQFEGAFGADLP